MTRSHLLCAFMLSVSAVLVAQAPASQPPATTSGPRLEAPDYRPPSLGTPEVSNNTSTTEAEVAAARAMIVRMDNWAPKSNQPAGIAIELRELRRDTHPDKTVVTYALHGTNIPKDKTFLLGRWPVGEGEKVALKGMTFNDQGRAICPGNIPDGCGSPQKPNQAIELPVSADRMEPIRFAILSEDKTVRAFTTAVPFPNLAKDGKCTVEGILGVPDRELVMIQGSGFAPGEPLKLHQSDPPRDQDIRAEADGTFSAAVLHPLNGNNNGTVSVKVTGASCAPEITYDWGPTVYKKVKAGLE